MTNLTAAQKAAETRKRNKARDTRLEAFQDALSTERRLMNEAVANGAIVTVDTAFGPYVLSAVTNDHWYITHPADKRHDRFAQRSWCGCNDGEWAKMLAQAGIARQGINATI